MLGRNCCSRLLTEASTNGVIALSRGTAEWGPYRTFNEIVTRWIKAPNFSYLAYMMFIIIPHGGARAE